MILTQKYISIIGLVAIAFFCALFILFPNSASANRGIRTVEIDAGIYDASGSGGLNTNTNWQLSTYTFALMENNVDILDAYLEYNIIYEAFVDYAGDHTGYRIGFDACIGCAPDPVGGSGMVVGESSTTLSYAENESTHVRLHVPVASEATMAAYTGASTVNFRSAWQIKHGVTQGSIANARAKLVITYEFDDTSTLFTNTVIYPLDSTGSGGGPGTRLSSTSKACTRNSNCPLFQYTATIPELNTTQVDWFEFYSVNDLNQSNDVLHNINIQGTDVNTTTRTHEAALGLGQGNIFEQTARNVSGASQNATQSMEWYWNSNATSPTQWLMGGEFHTTYTGNMSAATKTKTVRFPFKCSDDYVSGTCQADVAVYLPESGSNVEKAWFRIWPNRHTNIAGNIDVRTKVGTNAWSGYTYYNYDLTNRTVNSLMKIIHIIPTADYTEFENATAIASKIISLELTPFDSNTGAVSGELLVTYTYTGDTEYQETIHVLGNNDVFIRGGTKNYSNGPDTYFPPTGSQQEYGHGINYSLAWSDSDGAMPSAKNLSDSEYAPSTGTATCTNVTATNYEGDNMFAEFYNPSTTYDVPETTTDFGKICIGQNDGGDTSVAAKLNSVFYYTFKGYWPANAPTLAAVADYDTNPTLNSALAYLHPTRAHKHTDWLIMPEAETTCDESLAVWKSIDDAVNKTSIVVNTTNGTFQNALAGATELDLLTYNACMRSNNGYLSDPSPDAGDSEWSVQDQFDVNNKPAVLTGVFGGGVAGSITLTPGTTTVVTGTAEIRDLNGCEDLISPTVVFYRDFAGSAGADNDNYRYTPSCVATACTPGGSDLETTFVCTANVQYFADATDAASSRATDRWEMYVIPNDNAGVGAVSFTTWTEMDSLAAVSYTGTADYGTLSLGNNTGSTNEVITIENEGNVRLDLNLEAHASSFGDDSSMNCTVGSFADSYTEASLVPFTYGAGTPLIGVLAPLSEYIEFDADLLQPTGAPVTTTLYYGLGVPATEVGGNCSGILAVSPVNDDLTAD